MKAIVRLKNKASEKVIREKSFESKKDAMKYIKSIKLKPNEAIFGIYSGGVKWNGANFYSAYGKPTKKAKAAPKKRKTAKKATGVGSTAKKRKTAKKATGVGSTAKKRKTAKKATGKAINSKAVIREDILAQKEKVPVGRSYYGGKRPLSYRWKGNNFQVFYKSKWQGAESIDFDFINTKPKKKATGVGSTAKKRKTTKKKATGNKTHRISKPMGSTSNGSRKFAGKVYQFSSYQRTKTEAKKQAKELKAQGAKVRIIPVKSFYGDFAVYYR